MLHLRVMEVKANTCDFEALIGSRGCIISELATIGGKIIVECEASIIGKDHKRIRVCEIGEWRDSIEAEVNDVVILLGIRADTAFISQF